MQKLFAVIQLFRWLNGLITALSILVFLFVSQAQFNLSVDLVLLMLITVFSLSAGNVVNDIYDYETDRINRPKRPLVSANFSIPEAWSLYFILLILIAAMSATFNQTEILLIIFNNCLLYVYSYTLKGRPLIGNVVVAYLAASIFILFGIHLNTIDITLLFTVFTFFVHLIRELSKDLADIDGDRQANYQSFPIRNGVSPTKQLLYFLILLFAIIQIALLIYFSSRLSSVSLNA